MENRVIKATKNIVVSFFALVFIMGFFSKSIVNLFLPKVQAVTAMKGSFERSVELEGTIEPREIYKVRLGSSVIIDEYFVKIGQEVKVGDPIFKINNEYGFKREDDQIEDLKLLLEKEELRLERLKSDSFIIDEKNIKILEDKIQSQKNEILKLEKLYESGAVNYSTLERSKESLKELENNLEIKKLLLEEKKKENLLEIKEVENNIKQLKNKISEIEKKKKFYAKVGDDGIYYSDVDGVILSINQANRILGKDTTIVEIGKVNGYDSVKLVAYVPDKYYYFVKNAVRINIETQNKKFVPESAKIVNVSEVAENKLIEIEAVFEDEAQGVPVLGQKLQGKISKKYKKENTIPKAAVVPYDGYGAGKEGYVYVIEEKKGILGTEYIARKVDVTMLVVGDNQVCVRGLETFEKPRVITNLSYKIKDGVKVHLWE
ncbi:efflux RND transporter periplasmic adaptor subunit [Caloranaerobacter ferrireducens]|uniref:efflux RND transporter periplasmic adaptor subunit n=1 Tax=Caloranaerobacter ferrireducens TaxID=1323370 RepID=UPI00084D593F|nr:efflux RND transporter periplasmic adaptor subunit [Caloranaerobacter ferrireducens]